MEEAFSLTMEKNLSKIVEVTVSKFKQLVFEHRRAQEMRAYDERAKLETGADEDSEDSEDDTDVTDSRDASQEAQ
jgi:hypothetical protein